nr:dipeptidyl carboxypeptidase Dcp [Raoultella sp. NCTC 9187]
MALFYGDYYARDSKSGGAWMDVFVEQSTELRQQPVIYNVCNYQKPGSGRSALLSWDETITLFHEFGHALHGLVRQPALCQPVGNQYPARFCRVSVANLEHWASEPQVFAHYARHYQTGEAMPDALRESMYRAAKFNKGLRHERAAGGGDAGYALA